MYNKCSATTIVNHRQQIRLMGQNKPQKAVFLCQNTGDNNLIEVCT